LFTSAYYENNFGNRWSWRVALTGISHSYVDGVCSDCGLACTHNNVEDYCSLCGVPLTLETSTPYVGYYADTDADEIVDGIIFADLGFGAKQEGWGTSSVSKYSFDKVDSGLKEYVISQKSYTHSNWGTHPVVSPKKDTVGLDRFYIMALDDFSSGSYNSFYWYYNGDLVDTIGTTEQDFGEGYTKTGEMIERWNNSEYGTQDPRDVWGHITEKYNDGWFLPSKGEWAAFGGELGSSLEPNLTTSNYESQYGLKSSYLSSTQYDINRCYGPLFSSGQISGRYKWSSYAVRLSRTF